MNNKNPRNLEHIIGMEKYLNTVSHYHFINCFHQQYEELEDQKYLDEYINTLIIEDIEEEIHLQEKASPERDEMELFMEYLDLYTSLFLVFNFRYLNELKGFRFSYTLFINLIDTLDIQVIEKKELLYQSEHSDILFFKFEEQLRNISEFPLPDENAKLLFLSLSLEEQRILQIRS